MIFPANTGTPARLKFTGFFGSQGTDEKPREPVIKKRKTADDPAIEESEDKGEGTSTVIQLFEKLIGSIALGLALASSAQGCLRITGRAQQEAFSQSVNFIAVDNGLQVCSFDGGGKGDADCLLNYHLHFDYDDNSREGPLPMTYHNPLNGPFELRVPLSCFFMTECCRAYRFPLFVRAVLMPSSATAAPCTCADCLFDASFFC
ncbi:hypothetical protein B0H19DRAFT_1250638 [Mycena capillaripes]|nr:hypothetical protein B0H19DRAFT_1250638 [Mycena capillaripes]